MGRNTPVRTWTSALLAIALALLAAALAPATADARGDRAALDGAERALFGEINRTRARHGLRRLTRNRRLQRSADYHCWDMLRADFFAHSSSNGTPFEQRVERFTKRRRLGENLAHLPTTGGRRGARRVMAMWMNSPSHRAALLSPVFRRVGVARRIGRWHGRRVAVYTVDFASRR